MIAMPLARLRRSDDDRVVAGVCAGIAERLGVDPTLVRLLFTLLALAGGAGIVLYGAAWLWMTGRGLLAIIALVVAGRLAPHALRPPPHVAVAPLLIAPAPTVIWPAWPGPG